MSSAAHRGYFARRWHGQVPTSVLVWRDMLAVGSVINVGSTFVALLLLSQGSGVALATAVHFSPIPYNLFLFAAFWRSAQRTIASAAVATIWLCLMTLI